MRPFDRRYLPGLVLQREVEPFAPVHAHQRTPEAKPNAFFFQHLLQGMRDIGILFPQNLTAGFDHRHGTAHAKVKLRHLQPHRAPAHHHQPLGQRSLEPPVAVV